MSDIATVLNHYKAEFDRLSHHVVDPGHRQAALDRFVTAGFPSSRDEYWKYSDTRPLHKRPHSFAPEATLDAVAINRLMPAGLEALLLVFVNGRLSSENSDTGQLPAGVELTALLSESQKKDSTVVLDTVINGHGHALTDMNSAFAVDGACLRIAEGIALERPIYLLFIGQPTDVGQMTQIRNILSLAAGASATVIEHYVSANDTAYLNNCVTEIALADNARMKRIRIQTESDAVMQYGASFAKLGRDSHLALHSVDLGGRWQRYDSHIRLTEPGAEVHMEGLYVPTGRQHIDNHTCVEHVAPHCISREEYKGILDGGARGVFNGRVVVHKHAQGTDSEQSSAALLLSDKAEVDAKPELEIYADDVKCKHGATIGQLDERAVFYLQSRGLSETEARNLLTYSFADVLIHNIGIEPLQKHIESLLLAKLPQGSAYGELL